MEAGPYSLKILEDINRTLTGALDGLTPEELKYQPDRESNSIGFILWHQIRCEDMMTVATLMKKPEVWETGRWASKLGFADDFNDNGWGYTADQVTEFAVPELGKMIAYGEAVRAETADYLSDLTSKGLDEIIASPFGELPVSNILSMLICELALHTGHIMYVRGLQRGLDK